MEQLQILASFFCKKYGRASLRMFVQNRMFFQSSTCYCNEEIVNGAVTLRPTTGNEDELDDFTKLTEKSLKAIYDTPGSLQQVLIIHPRRLPKPQMSTFTHRSLLGHIVAESEALIETLPNYKVKETVIVNMSQPNTKQIFGSSTLSNLSQRIRSMKNISTVFLDVAAITGEQKLYLQEVFKKRVLDRYTVVLQIFAAHASTKQAKLQIALAEIPYAKAMIQSISDASPRPSSAAAAIGGSGESYVSTQLNALARRQLKLKKMLDKIQKTRENQRETRKRQQLPTVAVIGYTNVGKTSLIKALTQSPHLHPRDAMFATLDTTFYRGTLPGCHSTVLYIDTIGFLSRIPTSLVRAFRATLDDVIHCDVIVHVRDVSHPAADLQKATVLDTLAEMKVDLEGRYIEVMNKVDKLDEDDREQKSVEDSILVTCFPKPRGLDRVADAVERTLLESTGTKTVQLTVPNGGPELSWLYRHGSVLHCQPNVSNVAWLDVHVALTDIVLAKYKAHFGR